MKQDETVKREKVCSFLKPHSKDYKYVDNEGYILLVTGNPEIDEHKQTAFQTRFVEGYVVKKGNMSAAARYAGSQAQNVADTGKKTYEHPWVRHQIELSLAKQGDPELITQDEILKGIKEVIEMALVDGKYKEALDGYKLLGVEQDMFNPVTKQQISQTTVNITDNSSGDKFDKLALMLESQPRVLDQKAISSQIEETNKKMSDLDIIDINDLEEDDDWVPLKQED